MRLTGVDRSECLHDIRASEEEMALTPDELAKPHHQRHTATQADRHATKPRIAERRYTGLVTPACEIARA